MSIEDYLNKISLRKTLCFLFSGKAGVGKSFWSDTLQKYLQSQGFKAYKSPFAKGVKETASFMGWDGKKDDRGRKFLQDIGRAGRAYDINMWSRTAFVDIENSVGYPYDVVFIDDWRFEDEYKYIIDNEHLYHPIRIRIDAPNRELLVGKPEYDDVSEIGLDNFTFEYFIDNTKDGKDKVLELLELAAELEIQKMSAE